MAIGQTATRSSSTSNVSAMSFARPWPRLGVENGWKRPSAPSWRRRPSTCWPRRPVLRGSGQRPRLRVHPRPDGHRRPDRLYVHPSDPAVVGRRKKFSVKATRSPGSIRRVSAQFPCTVARAGCALLRTAAVATLRAKNTGAAAEAERRIVENDAWRTAGQLAGSARARPEQAQWPAASPLSVTSSTRASARTTRRIQESVPDRRVLVRSRSCSGRQGGFNLGIHSAALGFTVSNVKTTDAAIGGRLSWTLSRRRPRVANVAGGTMRIQSGPHGRRDPPDQGRPHRGLRRDGQRDDIHLHRPTSVFHVTKQALLGLAIVGSRLCLWRCTSGPGSTLRDRRHDGDDVHHGEYLRPQRFEDHAVGDDRLLGLRYSLYDTVGGLRQDP